jgi:hypothetical protein
VSAAFDNPARCNIKIHRAASGRQVQLSGFTIRQSAALFIYFFLFRFVFHPQSAAVFKQTLLTSFKNKNRGRAVLFSIVK